MRDPAFACKLEYLRGVERGQSTSAKLEVPAELLTAGCRIWVRSGRTQPFRRVRERISVLDFTWESDLHPMELRCSLPELGQYRSARALLKWKPLPGWRIENKVYVSSADSAIVYMPDFNVGKVAGQPEDFWVSERIEDWQALSISSTRWPLERAEPHGLLILEATEGQPEKHVAIAVGRELTVGRLHFGDQRYLNQSGRGAHWHLGWQRERVDPSFQGTREEVPDELLARCRDWMKRCAGVLGLRPVGEDVGIEGRSADDAGIFEVRRSGSREWELNLGWSEYRDSLRIHGEEAVVGESQVPWFWASRCGVEPGMEDRYFLWLPWHWELLDLAVGQGGWIDSLVRWQVERRELVFVDEGALEGTGL